MKKSRKFLEILDTEEEEARTTFLAMLVTKTEGMFLAGGLTTDERENIWSSSFSNSSVKFRKWYCLENTTLYVWCCGACSVRNSPKLYSCQRCKSSRSFATNFFYFNKEHELVEENPNGQYQYKFFFNCN